MRFNLLWIAGLMLAATAGQVQAAMIQQYASTVIGYSSQWDDPAWAASQALGSPDTFSYGDISTAWSPLPQDGTLEYITVGFSTLVYANQATIRETYGNGFVYQLDVVDSSDVLHTVWTGTDTSVAGTPVDFEINFAQTGFLVKGVKVYVDTNHELNVWEEIDSIQLQGDTSAVPEPASLAMWGLGAIGMMFARRKRQQKKLAA